MGDEPVELDLTASPGGDDPPDLHRPEHRAAVEAAIAAIPGVTAARLVAGYEREVDELHLVADMTKGAKQVVRDVQSLLYARYGISLDHRVVSVVQLEGQVPFGDGRRVAIHRVTATHEPMEVRVAVHLADGDRQVSGEAVGPASAAGRRRATARATMEAARHLLASQQMVEIESVAVEEVLGHDLAVVFVHFHGGRNERTVSGTALVRDDESAAIARAVLDALNRELTASG